VTYAETVAAFVGDRVLTAKHWPTTHTLFCDETGNSGSKFYLPDQPIYAEGGWLVAHGRRAPLEATILEIEQRFRFTPKTKGTKLKDSAGGRKYLATVLAAVGRAATPFFYLVEKKYFICAKAVSTFFDPNYNRAVDSIETFDPRILKLRADTLYLAPEAVFVAFAEAFRQQDPAKVTSAGQMWAKALADRGEAGLAMQLRSGLSELPRHLQNEFSVLAAAGLPRGWDSLNAPSVAQVFQLIERTGPPCDLVHDQCESLADSYRYFFDRYRNATPAVLPRLDSSGEIFGFQRLNSLTFGDSESLPLLRASDYLLASCVDFARRAIAQEEISAELRSCAAHGLGRMMTEARGAEPDPAVAGQIGEIMASDVWINRVALRFSHP